MSRYNNPKFRPTNTLQKSSQFNFALKSPSPNPGSSITDFVFLEKSFLQEEHFSTNYNLGGAVVPICHETKTV